jgi:hypothetical protein
MLSWLPRRRQLVGRLTIVCNKHHQTNKQKPTAFLFQIRPDSGSNPRFHDLYVCTLPTYIFKPCNFVGRIIGFCLFVWWCLLGWCVIVERHMTYPRTVVSVTQHNKYQTQHFGPVQNGRHHHLGKSNLFSPWYDWCLLQTIVNRPTSWRLRGNHDNISHDLYRCTVVIIWFMRINVIYLLLVRV